MLKKAKDVGATIIFEDETSFRQDSTIHATWARIGCSANWRTSTLI